MHNGCSIGITVGEIVRYSFHQAFVAAFYAATLENDTIEPTLCLKII